MKIALCLLTLNELEGCRHDVPKIKRIGKHFDEIFAVDNGSTDGTIAFLKANKIKVYSLPGISYNQQHHVAIKKTKADAVIFFPPKGTNSINDILKFRKYFERGYHLVVASRILKGGRNEEDTSLLKPRKWLTVFLALISAIRWRREGNIIFDCLHVFRGTTVSSFKKAGIYKKGQTFDIDQVIKSYKDNSKRIEFPTRERARIAGKTHFKTIPFGLRLIRYFIKEAFS